MRKPCVFCGSTVKSEEDVLSLWFKKRWEAPEREFFVRVGGTPLRTGKGRPARKKHRMWPVLLPSCPHCNGTVLNKLIEIPAQRPVRRLLNEVGALDTVGEITAVARWVAKVLLLEAHPLAKHEAYTWRPGALRGVCDPWEPYPRILLDAILAGTVPDDVSLWVAVTGPDGEPDPDFDPVVLQPTERLDGLGGIGRSRYKAFDLLGTDLMAQFQLVHHPLHDFEHPFQPHGLVTRLWPAPPNGLDLRELPILDKTTRLNTTFYTAHEDEFPPIRLAPGHRRTGAAWL
ncbi:hypothetical protein [Nocardia noduli]|uniref:hypothetical protein n=1 Tax=Nocardia noduli TaxID=2815722 RepID=UPI001C222830|nr:hypothetical protein [Nocardia noduli]